MKNLIRNSFIYDIARPIKQKMDVRKWEKSGKPVPVPTLVKQKIVRDYAKKFSAETLIETGTFRGDMINAIKDDFAQIFSVELDSILARRAAKRFAAFKKISIIQGNSDVVLPEILKSIVEPCLFWLDAHYSGGVTSKGETDTPIIKELAYILGSSIKEYVILIDDARNFVGSNGYPTIEQVRDLISRKHPDWVFEVKDDIIRAHKN